MSAATPVRDILLPSSDRIALLQAVAVVAGAAIATYLVRRERPLVLLTVGLGMTLLGLMALRTLH